MKSKFLTATAMMALALTGTSLSAQAETYARVGAGWSFTSDQDFDTVGGRVDTDLDTGYAITGAVGHDYGDLRAEVELSYRENDVDSHTAAGAATTNPGGTTSALALMANGYYDFPTQSRFTPYVGAGIGFAQVEADGYRANNAAVANGDDTVFAYQLIAGVEYPIAPKTSLTGEYRYFATADADINTSLGGAGSSDINYDNHSILVGVKHSFDTGM